MFIAVRRSHLKPDVSGSIFPTPPHLGKGQIRGHFGKAFPSNSPLSGHRKWSNSRDFPGGRGDVQVSIWSVHYYTDLKLFIFSFTLGHWYSLFPFSVRRIEKRKNVRDDVTVVLVAQGFTSLFLDQCSFHQVGNSFSEDVFPFKNCLFNFYWMENRNR